MDDSIENPDHWRERAKDARVIAKQLKDENMKNIMEDIARGYERIADHFAHKQRDANYDSR